MKEIFIALVVLALLALTAVRYRKQISGIIGVAKLLNEAKNAQAQAQAMNRRPEPSSVQLINCSKCGVWVPEKKTVKSRDGSIVCLNCS